MWQTMKIRTKTIQSTIPLFHYSSSPVQCLYTPQILHTLLDMDTCLINLNVCIK